MAIKPEPPNKGDANKDPNDDPDWLTPSQQLFVYEMMVDQDPFEAAARAGYKNPRVSAPILMKTPKVQRALTAQAAKAEVRFQHTQDDVLRVLWDILLADPRDALEWGTAEIAVPYDSEGKRLQPEEAMDAAVVHYVVKPWVKPKDSADLSRATAAAISSVKLNGNGGFEVKMHSKMDAADKLMRHLGMFEKDNERILRNPDGTPVSLTSTPIVAVFALPRNGRELMPHMDEKEPTPTVAQIEAQIKEDEDKAA